MSTKGIITAIVTIMIGVILTTGVLIPIIQDVSSNNTETGVKSITAGQNVAWVVTNDGRMFGTGENNWGQQGSGTTDNVTEFTQRLSDQKIKDVIINKSAPNSTWAITTDGKLFGCGRNGDGQQGAGTSGYDTDVTEFTQRLSDQNIAKVVNIGSSTWAITTDGKLFGCGSNNNGQQGSGDTTRVTTFTQRLSDQTVKDVYPTAINTLVVTTDGKLFGCGKIGSSTAITTFTQYLSDQTIDKVVETDTIFVLTTDGKLFGCGNNYYGQQGDGTTTNVTEFTQRLPNENIKDIVNENSESWVITTDGKLFGCGNNEKGQQGSGDTTNVTTFTQRLSDQTVEKVICSFNTTWAITTDGKLFSCGANESGQQGSGDTTDVLTFTQRLSDQTIANVTSSLPFGDTTWAITTDGKLFGCGTNESGQQGSGDFDEVLTFTQRLSDQKIKDVITRETVTYVLTDDGKLYTCGLNDNGQQGIDTDGESMITEFTLHDFGEPESSGNGVSPTISAMLSVIPLIVIVGLIIGTVGYFLRKQ